ncbi:MAG: hypothetical protein AAGA58_02405 [Verrucomicrobiota bacterium]
MRNTKFLALLAAISFAPGLSQAVLTLTVHPDESGNWVFRLTGSHTGDGLNYGNNRLQGSGFNLLNGGEYDIRRVDRVSGIALSGHSFLPLVGILDVRGDNVVRGDGTLLGLTVGPNGVTIFLHRNFGSSINDLAGHQFDNTLIVDPLLPGAFPLFFAEGEHRTTAAGFSMVVSQTAIPIPEPFSLFLLISCSLGFLVSRRSRR